MNNDERNLDLLSIFHYVVGGITALFSCFPFIHLTIGILFVTGAFENPQAREMPPREIGWLFIILASFFILCGWTLSLLILITGRKLKRRASYMFCLVVAALECLFIPLGTILGVFAIIVLTKDSVKTLFQQTG